MSQIGQEIAQKAAERMLDEATGEIIDRTDTPSVARFLKRVIEAERAAVKAKRWCVQALLDYGDERKEWGRVNVGLFKVEIDPPTASSLDWDDQELLKLENLLPRDRYLELCRPTVTLKPDGRKLKAIMQRDPESEVGQVIRRAEIRRPKTRGAHLR